MNQVRLTKRGLITITFLVIGTINCLAQYGTAGGYNELVRAQRLSKYEAESRKNDIKLSLSGSQATNPDRSASLDLDTLKIGDTGNLSYYRFTVRRVLDPTNCVIFFGSGIGRRSYVLTDYPTEKLVDDMYVFLSDDVKVCGGRMVDTHKYLVLKFAPLQAKKEVDNAQIDPTNEDQVTEDSETRLWTDNTGTYQISAKFIDVKDKSVVLECDQKQVDIPLLNLSSNDQAYVRGVIEKRKKSSPQ